jgi:hypothetical protein
MKIVRVLTYEGTEEQLKRQMKRSLKDGFHAPGAVGISIATHVFDGAYSSELTGQAANGWWAPEVDTFERALDEANSWIAEMEKHSQRQDEKIQALHAEIQKLQPRTYLEKTGPIV